MHPDQVERTLPLSLTPEEFERFWGKVDASGTCWTWIAGLIPQGYGSFWLRGKTRRSHKVAYESVVGPVPDGLVLDHICRNRRCVNPDHLRVVTHRENIFAPGSMCLAAQNAEKDECLRGHLLSGENLLIWEGKRSCRICRRVNDLRRYHERR
jgi:hypothetical protein